jgi:hypothetical protein
VIASFARYQVPEVKRTNLWLTLRAAHGLSREP